MKIFSFLYILFVIISYQLNADDINNIVLNGYTISDVCHGFICHGPIVVEYELIDDKDILLQKTKSNFNKVGQFSFDYLNSGKRYKFKITDTNFLYFEFILEVPSHFPYKQISKDLLVYPKADGVEMFFHISPFEYHKTRIRAGIDYYLDDLVALIKFNPDISFEIVSFPDDDENENRNGELTFNRCFNLRNFFIDKGIDESRILYMPNRKTDPKNPPYDFKTSKGKKYVGSTYLVIRINP